MKNAEHNPLIMFFRRPVKLAHGFHSSELVGINLRIQEQKGSEFMNLHGKAATKNLVHVPFFTLHRPVFILTCVCRHMGNNIKMNVRLQRGICR